jgi:hypothetical protein
MKKLILALLGLTAKKITNRNPKFGANTEYWKIPVFTHKTEFILFTENELEKARKRAEKNPEDLV